MRRLGWIAAALVLGTIVVTPAAARTDRDALIRPGVGIGKVRLGMTLAQVRSALGRPQFVNRRARLGFGVTYVEYAWSFGAWFVGFRSERGTLRAVRISTSSPRERTGRVGTGSRIRDVVRRFPNAQCRYHSPYYYGTWIFVRHGGGRLTAFAVRPPKALYNPPPSVVVEIIVKDAVREIGVQGIQPCPAGWRSR